MKIKNLKALRLLLMATLFSCIASFTYAQKGTLQDLKIIEGHWLGTFNGGPIEASWTAPMGDNIIGYIRMVKDNKIAMYELFAFEQQETGPVALVKHFTKGLIGLEDKDKSDRYLFIEAGKNTALFEKEDKSVRIIYELRKKDLFVLQRGVMENGEWKFTDLFTFNRVK
jgi:hypothetical protein